MLIEYCIACLSLLGNLRNLELGLKPTHSTRSDSYTVQGCMRDGLLIFQMSLTSTLTCSLAIPQDRDQVIARAQQVFETKQNYIRQAIRDANQQLIQIDKELQDLVHHCSEGAQSLL